MMHIEIFINNLQTCELQKSSSGGQGLNEATWSKLYNHTGNPVELAKPLAAYRVGHQYGLSVPIVYIIKTNSIDKRQSFSQSSTLFEFKIQICLITITSSTYFYMILHLQGSISSKLMGVVS